MVHYNERMLVNHDAAAATGNLASQIDALLPQTQCTRCGYPACEPYAVAIATGQAPINRCPPGGAEGISALASLLGKPELPLDPDFGKEGPRLIARIESEHCIGCTKCIVACPVDAIIGGPRQMHTVLPALCSGCELCVPPCPVDCIKISPTRKPWAQSDASAARERFGQRRLRLDREQQSDHDQQASSDRSGSSVKTADSLNTGPSDDTANHNERKRQMVAQAIARAQERKAKRR